MLHDVCVAFCWQTSPLTVQSEGFLNALPRLETILPDGQATILMELLTVQALRQDTVGRYCAKPVSRSVCVTQLVPNSRP